jgi:DNA-binding NarL/FixJ family response regulator
MAGMGLNILIGDASPRVRFGLRILLEQQPGWRVVGEAEDAQSLLESVRCGCPDLVLLDWELTGMPAEELLTVIRHTCPHLWIVFMSGKDELRQAAYQAGADVFAYKADPPEKLLGLIRGLMAESVISAPLTNSQPPCSDE